MGNFHQQNEAKQDLALSKDAAFAKMVSNCIITSFNIMTKQRYNDKFKNIGKKYSYKKKAFCVVNKAPIVAEFYNEISF